MPCSDLSIISNGGHYVSIDSRPVSCTRGVLKQMIGLYKRYLRSSCPSENGAKLVEPFISMNIVCPSRSYDANVEPAKDDILFMDSGGFLATLEHFFRSIYGELQPKDDSGKTSRQAAYRPRGFELLLARKLQVTRDSILPAQLGNVERIYEDQRNAVQDPPNLSPNPDTASTSDVQSNVGDSSNQAEFQREASHEKNEVSKSAPSSKPTLGSSELSENVRHESNQKRTWQHNMYSGDDEQDDDLYDLTDSQQGQSGSEDADEVENLRDVNISNPWTFAKLNAPIHNRPSDFEPGAGLNSNGQLLTPVRQRGDISDSSNVVFRDRAQDISTAAPGLPTPGRIERLPSTRASSISSPSQSFPFPMKAWGKGDQTTTSRSQMKGLEGERYSTGALDTWVRRSTVHNPTTLERRDSPRKESYVEHDMPAGNFSRDFVSARILPTGTPLSAILDVSQRPNRRPAPRKQQQNINKPFISPVNDPDRVWFETGLSRRTKPAQSAGAQSVREVIAARAPILYCSDDEVRTTERSPARTARPSPKPMHPDLVVTMDYEMRKQAAMQKRKEFLRQQALDARRQNQSSTDEIENALPLTNSPHKNRYNAAVASLSLSNPTATTTGMTSALEDSDPRAYLLRVQQREEAGRQSGGANASSRRLKRRKTTMLPLETTPAEATVQDLVFMIETTENTIESEVTKLGACDGYISAGRIGEGFASLGIEDVRAWEASVQKLVEERYQSEVGEKVSIEMDLWSAVQGLIGVGVATE